MEENVNIEEVNEFKIKTIELLKGFGTIFLYFFLTIVASLLLKKFYNSNNKNMVEIAQIGTYLILFLGLFLVYHKKLISDLKTFKKENIKIAIRNWFIGLIVMFISNLIIVSIVGNIAANESANREILTNYPISSIISMIFVGPLVEEITFRLSFKKAFNKWYIFATFTAILFGLAHIIADFSLLGLLYIIPYGALGFFFAKAMWETDNIYTSFISHMIHNAMCVFFILLF